MNGLKAKRRQTIDMKSENRHSTVRPLIDRSLASENSAPNVNEAHYDEKKGRRTREVQNCISQKDTRSEIR